MTPAEIAALKRLTAWNTGDTDAIPEAYTHDALTFQQDLRRVLTLAEQALRLQNIAKAIVGIMDEYRKQVAEGFADTPGGFEHMGDVWATLAVWDEIARAALAHAPGDGE